MGSDRLAYTAVRGDTGMSGNYHVLTSKERRTRGRRSDEPRFNVWTLAIVLIGAVLLAGFWYAIYWLFGVVF